MFVSNSLQKLAIAMPWIGRGMGILFFIAALGFLFMDDDLGMAAAAVLIGAVFYGGAGMAGEIVREYSESCRKNGL